MIIRTVCDQGECYLEKEGVLEPELRGQYVSHLELLPQTDLKINLLMILNHFELKLLFTLLALTFIFRVLLLF